jgi:hypothetical protein
MVHKLKGAKATNSKTVKKKDKRWKFNEVTIKKLEEAFAFDATIEEACFYADITVQTFYNWKKRNPELMERLEALRLSPVIQARKVVVDKLSDSYNNAMDYLKRKRKDEFSERMETESIHTFNFSKEADKRAGEFEDDEG